IEWYRKAARAGEPSALTNIALVYAFGQNVPKDTVAAYAFLTIAIAKGNETAKEVQEVIAKELTSPQIEEALELSTEPEKLWERVERTT
ncbi:MAG: hypothetical protein PHX59_10650, partial [Sulfuricurvum sp.]|nr:hypothetical protein [Sulfuricurvum sp.]